MIKTIPYQNRTFKFLLKKLFELQNKLQMRDWQIDLIYGDSIPEDMSAKITDMGNCNFDTDTLEACIWIHKAACKIKNTDPLNVLYHEMAHVWLQYTEDEERQANILALLIGGHL